jgi:putative transposase
MASNRLRWQALSYSPIELALQADLVVRQRDECLCQALFNLLAQAHFVLAAWRHDKNTVRPHSNLRGKIPAAIASQRALGHAPNTVVAITPSNGHQNGPRLYS